MNTEETPVSRQLLLDAVYKVRTDTDEAMKKVRGLGRKPTKKPGLALNIGQLVVETGFSRSTIDRYRKTGYEMEFGNKTSLDHFLAWVRTQRSKVTAADEAAVEERRRQLKARQLNHRSHP
jgi:predicted DNA-binding transcriptional regulator AlpA